MFSQESVLLTNGWQYTGKCNCTGTLQLKYKRDRDNLRIFPKRNYFKLNGIKYELSVLEEKTKSAESQAGA